MKFSTITFSLLIAVISSFAENGRELPDFSKAFPDENLVTQVNPEDKVRAYLYGSDLGFEELKKKFTEFIGEEWEELEIDEDTEAEMNIAMKDQNLMFSGYVFFTNNSFPGIQIGLTQVEETFFESSSLVTIIVDERNEADPDDADNPVNSPESPKNQLDD